MNTINKKYLDLQAVLKTPFIDVDSQEQKKAFKDIIEKKDTVALTEWADAFMKNVTRAEHGRKLPESITKFTGIGGIPAPPAQIAVYNAISDELQIDTAWMSVYDFVNVSGTSAVEIVDIDSTKGSWKNYAPGADIRVEDFGTPTYTQVKNSRWGFAVGILRQWIEQDQWWNVNRLMQSIMVKNQSIKATQAYTAIDALAESNTACAGTTLDDRVAALNSAYVTLVTRLSGAGFEISANTPAKILSRANHAAIINQILNRRQGSETNNVVVNWNITADFTFNSVLPTQPDGAKDGYYLYIPGLKNKWVTFDSLRTEQASNFGTDSVTIKAQEYWNSTLNVDQFQSVDLSN